MYARSFETLLPQLARCFPRSLTFYLALPKRSIRPAGLPIYVARVPAASFAHCFSRRASFGQTEQVYCG